MRSAQARVLIGVRMRELRCAAGVSLSRSAELSGWAKSHLSRVERGATRPSLPLVEWYDGAFGGGRVLVRQYLELDEAVRQSRVLTLRDSREAADGGHERRRVGGGTVPDGYDPKDVCRLVRETVPDGTLTEPGSPFRKEWTLLNAGPVGWHDRYITRQGSAGVPGWLESPAQAAIPDAVPGQEVTVGITMRAPRVGGMSTAYFKVTDADGRLYFPARDDSPLFCTVCVIDAGLAAPGGQPVLGCARTP